MLDEYLPLVPCGLNFRPGNALLGTERAKETEGEMGWRRARPQSLFIFIDF